MVIKCDKCGMEFDSSFGLCPACGLKVAEAEQPEEKTVIKNRKPLLNWRALLSLLSVVIVLTFVVLELTGALRLFVKSPVGTMVNRVGSAVIVEGKYSERPYGEILSADRREDGGYDVTVSVGKRPNMPTDNLLYTHKSGVDKLVKALGCNKPVYKDDNESYLAAGVITSVQQGKDGSVTLTVSGGKKQPTEASGTVLIRSGDTLEQTVELLSEKGIRFYVSEYLPTSDKALYSTVKSGEQESDGTVALKVYAEKSKSVMPNIIGLSKAAAAAKMADCGFQSVVFSDDESITTPVCGKKGIVVWASADAGGAVYKEQTITVYIGEVD